MLQRGDELPAPKFQQFERIIVGQTRREDFRGEPGTVVWLDSSRVRQSPPGRGEWLYVVELPERGCWRTFAESELKNTGFFDCEAALLGMRSEISFDFRMDENNNFMEGSYRLPGAFWKVFIFIRGDVPTVRSRESRWRVPAPTKWEREMSGLVFEVPTTAKLRRDEIIRFLSAAVGNTEWAEVDGPDSMNLR